MFEYQIRLASKKLLDFILAIHSFIQYTLIKS